MPLQKPKVNIPKALEGQQAWNEIQQWVGENQLNNFIPQGEAGPGIPKNPVNKIVAGIDPFQQLFNPVGNKLVIQNLDNQVNDPDLAFLENEMDAEALEMLINHEFEGNEAEPEDNFENKSKYNKLYDYVYKTVGSNYKQQDSKDVLYKTILSEDKRRIYHVQYPNNFKGNTKELLDNLRNGKEGFNQVFERPNPKVKLPSIKDKLKYPNLKIPKVAPVAEEGCEISEFYEKTNKYFDLVKLDYQGDLSCNNIHNTPLRNTIDIAVGKCAAYIYVIGKSNDGSGTQIIGITTGVFNTEDSAMEIIGCPIVKSNKILSSFQNMKYNKKCILKKYNSYYMDVKPLYDKREFDFIRMRIKSYEESAKIFGFKPKKKKMLGSIFTPNNFKITRGYKSSKLDKLIDIAEVQCEDGSYIKFLLNDLEFLYLDKDKFSKINIPLKKEVKKGIICKIIDNRKTSLEKGQLVTVLNIQLSNDNYRNSVITVRNNIDFKDHKVFLKQLKVYNNIENVKKINK